MNSSLFSRLGRSIAGQATKNLPRQFSAMASYQRAIDKNPVLVKSLTAALLSISSDTICQLVVPYMKAREEGKPYSLDLSKIDLIRTAKFSLLGAVLNGGLLHYWYGFLGTRIVGTGLVASLKRLACDQLIFAPAFISTFFSSSLILDGRAEEIPEKLKTDLFSTAIANFKVWVPAQFINFLVLPPQYQVLFANVVGFFWGIYLSNVNYNSNSGSSGSSNGGDGDATSKNSSSVSSSSSSSSSLTTSSNSLGDKDKGKNI